MTYEDVPLFDLPRTALSPRDADAGAEQEDGEEIPVRGHRPTGASIATPRPSRPAWITAPRRRAPFVAAVMNAVGQARAGRPITLCTLQGAVVVSARGEEIELSAGSLIESPSLERRVRRVLDAMDG